MVVCSCLLFGDFFVSLCRKVEEWGSFTLIIIVDLGCSLGLYSLPFTYVCPGVVATHEAPS